MKRSNIVYAVLAAVLAAATVRAASLPYPFWSGPYDPSQMQNEINSLGQSVNQNTSGYQPLNFLDNADLVMQQRGTSAVTCGTTGGPGITAYSADRWACEVNVTSGAGRMSIVTSATGVTFAPGVPTMLSLYRTSGALTQPISAEQEIKTARFSTLQGRPIGMSCWLAANAGAPSGVTASFHVFTGTGTDEGLGALRSAVGMTASPALTPALTGLATTGTYTTPALTTTATRYSSGPIYIPNTATEAIFEVDWTPGAETFGTTDGILIGDCQLEEFDPNQPTAGRFQRVSAAEDAARSYPYYFQTAEANGKAMAAGECTATNVETAVMPIPAAFDATPTLTFTAGTWKWNNAGTNAAVTGPTLSFAAGTAITLADTTTCTAGNSELLLGTATTGKITLSADY